MDSRRLLFILGMIVMSVWGCGTSTEFRSILPEDVNRVWLGPQYWSNPLQDWRLHNGRIECVCSGGERNVYLLTHQLSERTGTVFMSVHLGRLEQTGSLDPGWVGFSVGVRGEFNDYRDSAVRGEGYWVGLTTDGRLFIGDTTAMVALPSVPDPAWLTLQAQPADNGYRLTLICRDDAGSEIGRVSRQNVDADWLIGGVALMCHAGEATVRPDKRRTDYSGNWGFKPGTRRRGNVRFWFQDWQLRGDKVEAFPQQAFGPILFCQYTLSRGVLKLTAQFPPISEKDGQRAELWIKDSTGGWQQIATASIDSLARTATFRVENWDSRRDVPYQVRYRAIVDARGLQPFVFDGLIRKEPIDQEELVLAAFTGNNDLGFPNNDLVAHVQAHDPDVLFFSGDQIYEGVGGYGVQRAPLRLAYLDYLRKWYLYGWEYRELLKDRPTIAIPDDHDVYHGNLWGDGGKATPPGLTGAEAQDAGGYKMPPEFVNMVQRTQTSHLPDPVDPRPVDQGIGVYFTEFRYGGISFAILEDRKFKSPPKRFLPKARVWNGFAQNPDFDPLRESDAPGATLLGDRQLAFLRGWAQDWSNGVWMKCVLSQTIFNCVQTLPRGEVNDQNVPKLRILQPGEYPPDDVPVADMDSNGWPPSSRNRALREIRKAFAVHIAGDQHLGSTIQYGVEDWRDAGFALCVPSVSNVWPRRWFPRSPGKNRQPGAPLYTGDFLDGLGNKMTVLAVANPYYTGLKPSKLYDRATGYGIARFHRTSRKITLENWPRWVNPTEAGAKPYPGWPITIEQLDNYGRKPVAYLPEIRVTGLSDPVVQVIREQTAEVEYTLRIRGTHFQPWAFEPGLYTIKVGEPGTEREKEFRHVQAQPQPPREMLRVQF